jgi:hypothetical protein
MNELFKIFRVKEEEAKKYLLRLVNRTSTILKN